MARDGWGSTLHDELGVRLPDAAAGGRRRTTRADAEKRERRQKTRRWTAYDGVDALQRKREARLERLEATNVGDPLVEGDNEADDDAADSDEFVDLESDSESSVSSDDAGQASAQAAKSKKRRRSAASGGAKKKNSKKKAKKASASADAKARKRPRPGQEPRRKRRSLADILLDENARKLSTAETLEDLNAPDYFSARAGPPRYPARKLCAVTGLPAPYKDPESNLYFAHARAFEQLREQPPHWVKASATAPFHEALRIIADERARVRARLAP